MILNVRQKEKTMRILIALDGSDCSKACIDDLNDLNCLPGTEIKVVSVVDFIEPLPVIDGFKEKEIKAAQDLVEKAAEQIRAQHPNTDVSGEVLDGFVTDEILELSYKWKADLILVGSHGRHGFSEFLVGSVSRGVLLHARCAVRIVRPSSKHQERGANVLIALDESVHSSHVLDHILKMPWPQNTRFKCVHVMPELSEKIFLDPDCEFASRMSHQYDDLYRIQKKLLDDAAKRLKDAYGKKVASSEVLFGDPRQELLKHAKEWPANLIVLGSHGRRGIEKLLLGSVSETVATHANCSVEVTRIPAIKNQQARLPHIVL